MPTGLITIADRAWVPSDSSLREIRSIVAHGLDSRLRHLDESHISLRFAEGSRDFMLGEVEVELFCQLFRDRFFSRDKRANYIARHSSAAFGTSCACWINMSIVGYSRFTLNGLSYYSD